MTTITPYQHQQLEFHALRIKIEKLSAWMQMYRDERLRPDASRNVLEIMVMINEAQRQQQQLLINNKKQKNMAFAKIYEAKPSQILVTKIYPKSKAESYGIKITTAAVIDKVPVELEASITNKEMSEKDMDELFEEMGEQKAKDICNQLYEIIYSEKF